MSDGNVVAYRITYMSSSDVPFQADIRCYGSTEFDAPEVALIRFYRDPSTIPPDGLQDKVNAVPVVNYPLDCFNDIITILRDEDNVGVNTFIYFSGTQPVRGWGVSTGMEPISEMEPGP